MSFSGITKEELARLIEPKTCCDLAELAALVRMDGTLKWPNQQYFECSYGKRPGRAENLSPGQKCFGLSGKYYGPP